MSQSENCGVRPVSSFCNFSQQVAVIQQMQKPILTVAALLLIGGSLMSDTFRVHYSVRGSGRDITVQAESSAEPWTCFPVQS